MAKRRIKALLLGDCIRYTIQQKEHWWNRWNYIFDGKYPRLFSYEELVKFGFIHPALNNRLMKQPSEIYTNFMKYIYTITVESEDLMTSELIAEDLDEVFDPSGLGNKLRGIVTHISRKKVEPKE